MPWGIPASDEERSFFFHMDKSFWRLNLTGILLPFAGVSARPLLSGPGTEHALFTVDGFQRRDDLA